VPRLAIPAAILAGLAVIPAIADKAASRTEAVYGCMVTDGDTIRCGDERVRLLGIDAPEMPGHCRSGRACVEGDPFQSSANLGAAMGSTMTIVRVGTDRYGRTLATVAGPQGDLSCWQLTHRQAEYRSKWDNGLRVARTCPRSIF
jgi:endonuclease YncB( thermonuclease family)